MQEQNRIERPGRWQRIGYQELTILVTLVIILGGVFGFVKLASEIGEGETHTFDEKILLAMRNPTDHADPLGPPWVEEMGRDFTALGGTAVLTFLTLSLVGYLLLTGRRDLALLVAVAIGGGMLINVLLKHEFNRPRPDLVPHGVYVYDSSFPSGHSMGSAATYLTLGALLARLQPRRRLKIYIMVLAMLLTFLVGLSRVYLGVHWPTDVLGGWTAGALWALLCWSVTVWLQQRGQVSSQTASPV
ncbi:MAG: phosphatase PAP2 family protein [Chloroflexi bacterium]|nr:phosphatase PAP2 family protein [Chloroflexota bacterium]